MDKDKKTPVLPVPAVPTLPTVHKHGDGFRVDGTRLPHKARRKYGYLVEHSDTYEKARRGVLVFNFKIKEIRAYERQRHCLGRAKD
jgi:hypothetical protein